VIKPLPGYGGKTGWDNTVDRAPITKTYGDVKSYDKIKVPGWTGYVEE